MSEYSYFRAEGRSLEAISIADEADKRIKEEILGGLAKEYGAFALICMHRGKDGEKDEFVFGYMSLDKVPEDFSVIYVPKGNNDDETNFITANPKPGTTAAFNVASMTGLLPELRKRNTLELVFGCGEMPAKTLPAGACSSAFVRTQSFISEYEDYPADRTDAGIISETTTHNFGGPRASTAFDPLSYMSLCGDLYIRVPNDETGKPRYTPPDSTPMKYEDMLLLDGRQYYGKYPSKLPSSPARKLSGP